MIVEPILLALVIAFLLFLSMRPNNFPPGPKGLPILGYIPFLVQHDYFPHKAMKKLADIYGPVTGFYLGPSQANISVCGYEAVKEALLNHDLNGRPTSAARRERTFGKRLGLMFVDGEFFREQRRFTLRHLRDLGFGQTSSESVIQAEIQELVNEISTLASKHPKQLVDFNGLFTLPLINILWAIVGGERFERHDPQLHGILKIMDVFFRSGRDVRANIPIPSFVLKNAPYVRKFLSLRNDIFGPLQAFIREKINDHERTRDAGNPRDFIDVYLAEMEKQQQSNPSTSFEKDQLISLIIDLFIAAGETTGNAIGFALLYLMRYPDVQAKVHAELDEKCGGSMPSLSHRMNLPYTQAVMLETLRLSNITPLTIPHCATKDTQLGGFTIPKGTIVSMNLYAVHLDEKYWDRPEVFLPERHLNSVGKLAKTDHLLPFGAGKRACLGESLARNTLFLFLTSLMKKFEFRPMPGQELPTLTPKFGFTSSYDGFEAVILPRKVTE